MLSLWFHRTTLPLPSQEEVRGTGPLSSTSLLALPLPTLHPTSLVCFWLIPNTAGADAARLIQEALLLPSAASASEVWAVADSDAEEPLDLQGLTATRVGRLQEEGRPQACGGAALGQ